MGDIMDNLLDEYKINNVKVINERHFSQDNNIIELLYELFLLTKDSDNNDYNKTK